MPKILGLCNLHNSPKLGFLNEKRALASTSFLGRYNFIDFTLSNFANSGIDQIGILVEDNLRSIVKHISSGRIYNSNTKTGFCSVMYNEQYANNKEYNNDINNLMENHWVLDQSNAEYVVVAPAHIIYRFDFKDMLKYHIEKKASVTMLYYKATNAKKADLNCDELKIDENGRVLSLSTNKGAKQSVNISLDTYIISRNKLEEFLQFGQKTSNFFSLRDVLAYLANQLYIHSYEYKGYVRSIDSIKNYKKYSLELLERDVLNQLFDNSWPIYTRTNDTPPAKYKENASVKNCFIANGAIIDGIVNNSIIGRSVIIEKGAIIKNSIILNGAHIGENALLDHVIIDKNAEIILKKELIGTLDKPLIVREGNKI